MHPEILEVYNELADWRLNKKFLHSPIPDYFWDKFKELNNKYPDQNIKQMMKLNSESWKKKILNNKLKPVPLNNFIHISSIDNSLTSSYQSHIKTPPQVEESIQHEDIQIKNENKISLILKLTLKNGNTIELYQ